ncbi:MAG: hypothetical protein ACTSQS_16510 [Promethearchaeota archaeon]
MSIDWIPARKVIPKERGNRGMFPLHKVPSGFAEYESCLERDKILSLHYAPDMKRFQYQPKTIVYKNNKGTTNLNFTNYLYLYEDS